MFVPDPTQLTFPHQVSINEDHGLSILNTLSQTPGFICLGNPHTPSLSGFIASALPINRLKPEQLETIKVDDSRIVIGLYHYPSHQSTKNKQHSESYIGEYHWFMHRPPAKSDFTLYFSQDCDEAFIQSVMTTPNTGNQSFQLTSSFTPTIPKEQYFRDVNTIQSHILAGDCYQINYAQRFEADYTGSPWAAYQTLGTLTDAQYCAYLDSGDRQVLCLSPELFLGCKNRQVITKPIKGTQPRGITPQEDSLLKETLINSEKDKAENLMITDLLRNDLGRFCETGSIQTTHLFDIESYSNVHHMVSTVTGTLKSKHSSIEAFLSAFPGGSITGAPKIKAMEIINSLESFERGPYCGSFFYLLPNGDFCSNIAIRTLYCENNKIFCFGGGGIVADSSAEAEYAESVAKIDIFMKNLEQLRV